MQVASGGDEGRGRPLQPGAYLGRRAVYGQPGLDDAALSLCQDEHELPRQHEGGGGRAREARRVQVQDRVITTLRMTQPSELQEADGITALKQRLLDGINELLVAQGGRAYEVYLSS